MKCSFPFQYLCRGCSATFVSAFTFAFAFAFVFVGDNDKKYRNDQHDCTEYGDEIYGGDQDDNMKKRGVYK